MVKRFLRTALACAAFFCCALGSSVCFETEGTRVFVNRMPVFDAGASERAATIVGRLSGLKSIGAISVREGSLLVGGFPIMEGSSHWEAEAFASHLTTALALPALQLGKPKVLLPAGGAATVTLCGAQAPGALVKSQDASVVNASPGFGELRLTAGKPGKVLVVVTSQNGQSASLLVEVQPYAADFPQTLRAKVGGRPATASTVRGAVLGAVNTSLKTQPNADMRVLEEHVSPIPEGAHRSFRVKVRALAPDSFPVEGWCDVDVTNVPMPKLDEADLWYCNSPESVHKARPLFSAYLTPERPVRLLYHHRNAAENPMLIRVWVANDSDKPSEVFVVPGDSGPERDPLAAGARAAHQFLTNWLNGDGDIVAVPAHGMTVLSLRRLYSGQTQSGLCALTLLSGGADKVVVRADAVSTFSLGSREARAAAHGRPWRVIAPGRLPDGPPDPLEPSEHVYPYPYVHETLKFLSPTDVSFARLGEKPLLRTDGEPLKGNYGVVYRVDGTLVNSTDHRQTVDLMFEASGGYTCAVVAIGGDVIRTSAMQGHAERRLTSWTLEPGESKVVTLTAIPVSGGNYPATLTLRARGSHARYSADRQSATKTSTGRH